MDELEEILEWLEKIRKDDSLVIVEGKKDRSALEKFGIFRVKTLSKRALYKVAEEAASYVKKAVLLTDLDKEGKILFSKIRHELCQNGVYVDSGFRNFLFKSTKLRQIEGLYSYTEKLRENAFKNSKR